MSTAALIAPAQQTRSNVISEIQGLRAIAVLAVIAFHLWPSIVRGGFVGVDVFFVVSGYLITGHLVRDAERRGKVDVLEFWARRMRRLLPASLLVLGVVAVVGVAALPVAEWPSLGRNLIGSTFYVENWVLAADATDYWAQAAAAPPTQHYWSLSVEEQFYFLWPLVFAVVVMLVRRRSVHLHKAALLLLGAIVVCGLGYSVWYSVASPEVAYFSTFTRAWEFALGGFVGLSLRLRPRGNGERNILSWMGVAAILLAVLLVTSDMDFPGWIALLPTLGTAAVLLAGRPVSRWSFSSVSSRRSVMYIGDISYSLYLWHWPLVVLLPALLHRELRLLDKLGVLLVTFVLAALTKRFVEDPARRAKWLVGPKPVRTFAFAGLASAVLLVVGLALPAAASTITSGGLAEANRVAMQQDDCVGASAALGTECGQDLFRDGIPAADIVFQDFDARIEECFSQDDNAELIDCRFGTSSDPSLKVALVGDSHAGALAPGLIRLAEEREWDLHVYLKPGCPWSDTVRFREDGNTTAVENCVAWRDQVTDALSDASPAFDAVVTTSYAIVGNMVEAQGGASAYDTSVAALSRTWNGFLDANPSAKLIVVRDNPNWDNSPVVCLQQGGDGMSCVETLEQAFSNPDPQLAAADSTAGVSILDLTDVYCPDGVCRSVIGGLQVYRDAHHLSKSFALSLAPVLGARIDSILTEDPEVRAR